MSHFGGVIPTAAPAGVPVVMMSPGCSVVVGAAQRDSKQNDPFARQVLLLNSWRRLTLRDPGLPQAGLPVDWADHAAARMFLERFHEQQPEAEAAWSRILSESEAQGGEKKNQVN
jgi:DNA-binding transcriptional regulator PaaX